MARRLPPLNPLHVFDVAARCTSFTDAANQLSVTQAAVSRQVSALEGYFGIKLFDREQRALTLTSEGRRLHREIGPAFEAIGLAAAEILRQRDPNVVTIQTYPTVIAQKLLPNFQTFVERNRKIEVHFLSAVRPEEFSLEQADIVIRLASEKAADLKGFRFAQDVIVPAASADIVKMARSKPIALLTELPLVVTKFRSSDWTEWATAADVSLTNVRYVYFESSSFAYQAARLGAGVCMAQEFLISGDVAGGRLVPLSDKRLPRPSYYWCLVSPRRRMSRQIVDVINWLEGLKVTGEH
jgi:LysR family transcriptional regulator, glycine cleavage system transcriptional activator